ncbi:MAG: hypothetical protein L0H71_09620 [Yaniella sp.]|nr:hypothetical protein [Yaniella sp.]
MNSAVQLVAETATAQAEVAWYDAAITWFVAQGALITTLAGVIGIGTAIYRLAPRLLPIPLARRRRAWELLKRVGELGDGGSQGLTDAVQALVIREEAYGAVRRPLILFLFLTCLVYPIVGVGVLFLAAEFSTDMPGPQLIMLGVVLLLALPVGFISSIVDAHWNRRILHRIDSLLERKTDTWILLLANPVKAINDECERTGDTKLMRTGRERQAKLRRKQRGWKKQIGLVRTSKRLLNENALLRDQNARLRNRR